MPQFIAEVDAERGRATGAPERELLTGIRRLAEPNDHPTLPANLTSEGLISHSTLRRRRVHAAYVT
jgi:hypothetical protein